MSVWGKATDFLWSAPITGIGSPRGITVGNFGGAGASQIALADNGSNDVEILVSDDGGTFAPLQSTWGIGNGPVGIASADFNGDGCLDVATADNSSASMTVLLNTCSDAGSIDFENGTTYFIGGGRPQWLVTADLNQDGYPDLAMAFYDPAPGGGNIAVFLNKGDGSFPQTPTYLTAGSGASWIVSADFNNDGKPDLAIVNKDSDNLSVFLGQ